MQATWQLFEAKQKLSEVIERALCTPQIITVRGEETAIVMSMQKYREITAKKPNLCEFLRNSPLNDDKLAIERDTNTVLPGNDDALFA
jgi:prevent-host-death family protein